MADLAKYKELAARLKKPWQEIYNEENYDPKPEDKNIDYVYPENKPEDKMERPKKPVEPFELPERYLHEQDMQAENINKNSALLDDGKIPHGYSLQDKEEALKNVSPRNEDLPDKLKLLLSRMRD